MLLAFFLLFRNVSPAEVNDVRRVLVFNDFDPIASPGVALLDQAIFAAVNQSRYQIEWYDESLGANLFTDEASQRHMREWYVRKYQDRKPNLIITVGPASLQFMSESHERLFPGIPIIFCGSSEEMLERLKPDSHFTGVWGTVQPEQTFKAALHLQPTAKHVVVVGGVGAYDRYLERIVKRSLQNYESKFEFTYLTDLDMPTLLGRLSRLPSDTIVLYTSIFQDAAGAHFIDANQSAPMVVGATNVPVFVLFDVNFGTGAVGGDIISFASDGKIAGQMAVRILNGEKLGDIPVVKNANVMMFDWRALRRWRFKESDLPPGSVVFYRQFTVWEAYKQYIILGVTVMLAEALLIFGLLWQRKQRKKAAIQLRESEERLRLAAQIGRMFAYSWDAATDVIERSGESAEILGVPKQEAVTGAMVSAMVHPDDKGRLEVALAQLSLHNPMLHITYRILRPDGAVIWVERNSRAYFHGNGKVKRIVGMVLDVTERKRAKEALAEMTRKMIAAQEQERSRIGRELHDDITQRLAMVAVELERLQQHPSGDQSSVQGLRQEVAEISNDVQALSHDLHASKLEYLGVVAGIKSWCKEFSERQRIEIDFKNDVSITIPLEIGHTLFRVLQEAMHNVVKHSGVKRVEVQLRGNSAEIHLRVTDLGRGFDVEAAFQSRGLGLWSMRERVRLVNGTVSIESKPIGGTTIEVRVPLESQRDSQLASKATD